MATEMSNLQSSIIENTNTVDAHAAAVLATSSHLSTDLSTVIKAARPILLFASTFFLIPANWRAIITGLIAALDAVYPPATNG